MRAFFTKDISMGGLKSGISFCFVDGHPVFLDVNNDRYLTLLPPHAALFRAWLADASSKANPDFPPELEETDLFDQSGQFKEACRIDAPRRTISPVGASIKSTMRLAITMISDRSHRCALDTRLARLSDPSVNDVDERPTHVEQKVGVCEASLLQCRRLLSATDQCLADGLAIARHLRREGVPARLVFGVRLPFAAHCWVQVGDVIVGDTLERVRPFTPIYSV